MQDLSTFPKIERRIRNEFQEARQFWEQYGISPQITQFVKVNDPRYTDLQVEDLNDAIDGYHRQFGGVVILHVGNINDPDGPLGPRGTSGITADSQNGFAANTFSNEVTIAHEFAHVISGLYHIDTIQDNILHGSLADGGLNLDDIYVSQRQLETGRKAIQNRNLNQ